MIIFLGLSTCDRYGTIYGKRNFVTNFEINHSFLIKAGLSPSKKNFVYLLQ